MYYNSGWCNTCSCNSCDCTCGRKTVLQQSKAACCNSTSGRRFCKEPIVYLTSNFTIPAANVEVEVSVSDATRVYKGQGIQISTYYFQVTEIVDARTIKIAHNGSATPAAVITAVSATYGCFQYPIYFVGIVEIAYTADDIIGVDASFVEVADSVVDPVLSYTYGYLGPDKIQFNLEITAEIANTPEFIEIPLPDAASTPGAVFSAVIIDSSVPEKAIAYKRGSNLIVGPGNGTNFANDTGVVIQVSGSYGV